MLALVGFGASWVAMNNPGRLGSIQLNEPKSQLVGAGDYLELQVHGGCSYRG